MDLDARVTHDLEEHYVEELGEFSANHLSRHEGDAITCLRFDPHDEALWLGTAAGDLINSALPDLSLYASISCHEEPILNLRSSGQSCVSISPSRLCLHLSGCAPRLDFQVPEQDLSAVEFEDGRHRVLLGRAQGGITSFDLVTGRPGFSLDTKGKGVVALAGPLARARVAVGTMDGHVSLCDTRTGRSVEATLSAHPAGFAAFDAAGDLIATAGFIERYGRLSLEPVVKLFDVRMGLRMLTAVPFAGGAAALRFNPAYPSTLTIVSGTGMFSVSEVGGYVGHTETHAIHTEGDAIMAVDASPSGTCLAFGSSSGYAHFWSSTMEPMASLVGEILVEPDDNASSQHPTWMLGEDEPFSKVPTYYAPDGGPLASDVNPNAVMNVGMAPRIIDKALLASGKCSDFVTYIPNFKKTNDMGPGRAAAAIAPLQNNRQQAKLTVQSAAAERAARAARRAAEGGIVLPECYRRVTIKKQTGAKFEEFDFSYYNKTPFPGLENGIANCYVNALLQVLFFTSGVRRIALRHSPDPNSEFSLLGELSLLFRMLLTAKGHVCQVR